MATKSPAMSHLLRMSCGYVSNQSQVAGEGLEHGLEQRVRGYGGKGSRFLPFFLSFFFFIQQCILILISKFQVSF